MKIYAPVKDFNGLRQGIRFVNGVGETDNRVAIEWFRSHGYKVPLEESNVDNEPVNETVIAVNDSEESDEPDFDSMTPIELRDWAKANGLGGAIKNTRNKEKLLELIKQIRG